jgi:hypothetical protein
VGSNSNGSNITINLRNAIRWIRLGMMGGRNVTCHGYES